MTSTKVKKAASARTDSDLQNASAGRQEHSTDNPTQSSAQAGCFGTYPIRDIALSSITANGCARLRDPDDPVALGAFVQSVKESGQINPITVRPNGTGYVLVAGMYRFMAAQVLKWKTIKCWVRSDLDDDGALLIEIDENLIRKDLTPDQLRDHLIKRKEIWLRRHPEEQLAHDAPPVRKHGHRQAKGFAAEVADVTGMSKAQINRILAGKKPKRKPTIEEVVAERGAREEARRAWEEEEQEQQDGDRPTKEERKRLWGEVRRERQARFEKWREQRRSNPTVVRYEMALRIIDLGYRALAKEMHPDVGGKTEDMSMLNDARAFLKRRAR